MPTVNYFVTKALRKCGALAQGQTADGNDALDCLDYLNDMLDQWTTEDLLLYYSFIISHALVAGTESYTIGPTGAAITATRPLEILGAGIRDSSSIDTPIRVVSFDDYEKILQKETQGTYPSSLAYQPTFPNGTIYVWQSPSAGLTLRMQVNAQFAALTAGDLAQEINLPPGYNKCIIDCLTKEIAPEWGRSELIDQINEDAKISKMLVKRKNTKKNTLSLDPAFLLRSAATYNPYSDR